MDRYTSSASIILLACATVSCAHASSSLHTGVAFRQPVGVRLIPQPRQDASRALDMDLSAYQVPEPAQVDVRLRVEPDARSRSLTIEWWTEDNIGGSHVIQLDGEDSKIRFTFPIRRLTEGEYSVVAILRRSDGTEARQRRRVIVLGEPGNLSGAMF